MSMKTTERLYYIERVDVSWCYVEASSPEEANVLSGDGANMPHWETDIGEPVIKDVTDE